jgi:hypothetical protein
MATFGAVRAGVSVRNVTEPRFGDVEAFELPRRARAGVALTGPGRGGVGHLTLAFDVDLIRATVSGRDEQRLAGGFEA